MKIFRPCFSRFELFAIACGNRNSLFRRPHENSSANLASKFANQQVVIPEYDAVESVMVSYSIRDYGREDL